MVSAVDRDDDRRAWEGHAWALVNVLSDQSAAELRPKGGLRWA